MFKQLILCLLLTLTSASAFSATQTFEQELAALSRDVESVTYATEVSDTRTKALDELLARAIDLKSRFPDRGLPYAWVGWLKYNALFSLTDPAAAPPLLQDARASLEKAIEIEPNCCGAEAYVTLAIIYQVPLTGADQRDIVRKYFAKAFAIDPNGLIPNTRFAGFSMRNGEYDAALKHANAALAAPPLLNRPGEDRLVRDTAKQFIEQTNDRIKRAKEVNTAK